MSLSFKLLSENAMCPTRGKPGDAGLDLYSAVDFIIPAYKHSAVPTNIAVEIPPNYYGRIAPRSGLAYKNGIDVFAGVADSSYRGELKVILFNGSPNDFKISKGDRIAQLIVTPYLHLDPVVVEELSNTERGDGGFGSTGV